MKRLFPRSKPAANHFAPGRNARSRKRQRPAVSLVARLGLAVAITVLLVLAHVSLVSHSAEWVEYSFPVLKAGDISPRREIAPFDFDVPKPERQLEQEREQAALAVLPVFNQDRDMDARVTARIDTLMAVCTGLRTDALPDTAARRIVAVQLPGFTFGFVDTLSQTLGELSASRRTTVTAAVKKSFGNVAQLLIIPSRQEVNLNAGDYLQLAEGDTVSVEMTVERAAAADLLAITFNNEIGSRLTAAQRGIIGRAMSLLLEPNLTYSPELTAEYQTRAREAVPVYSAQFKENERLIDANVPVTQEQLDVLDTLKREIARRSFDENRWRYYLEAFGQALMNLGILGAAVGFLFLYRRRLFESFSKLLLITLLSSLPLIVAFYSARSGVLSQFLIPVGVTAILVTILFDAELGVIVTTAVSLIVATFFASSGIRIGIVYLVAGCLGGVFTVGRVRHRREFYRSMVFLPLVMVIVIAATNDWVASASLAGVGNEMLLGALNGFFCPILSIGLLPVLESLFKVSTDITLLELADLNNPLLKELAVNAPGTFSGSLVVGTLAEAAAERVGANPLLARVGSYYHDIGKLLVPEYYIENQFGGENPHDHLTPSMSALVLIAHVKEGYELGSRYGLPEVVLDIILQHHGTSLMQSFYHKALEEAGDSPVDDSAFKYAGPKPQTREAGIVMLADLSEAASRTVQEKSLGRLKSLVNTIIQKRFMDGELNECDLTLRDLHLIEESFLPVLVGSHHGRIAYPWQREQAEHGKGHGAANAPAATDSREAIDREEH